MPTARRGEYEVLETHELVNETHPDLRAMRWVASAPVTGRAGPTIPVTEARFLYQLAEWKPERIVAFLRQQGYDVVQGNDPWDIAFKGPNDSAYYRLEPYGLQGTSLLEALRDAWDVANQAGYEIGGALGIGGAGTTAGLAFAQGAQLAAVPAAATGVGAGMVAAGAGTALARGGARGLADINQALGLMGYPEESYQTLRGISSSVSEEAPRPLVEAARDFADGATQELAAQVLGGMLTLAGKRLVAPLYKALRRGERQLVAKAQQAEAALATSDDAANVIREMRKEASMPERVEELQAQGPIVPPSTVPSRKLSEVLGISEAEAISEREQAEALKKSIEFYRTLPPGYRKGSYYETPEPLKVKPPPETPEKTKLWVPSVTRASREEAAAEEQAFKARYFAHLEPGAITPEVERDIPSVLIEHGMPRKPELDAAIKALSEGNLQEARNTLQKGLRPIPRDRIDDYVEIQRSIWAKRFSKSASMNPTVEDWKEVIQRQPIAPGVTTTWGDVRRVIGIKIDHRGRLVPFQGLTRPDGHGALYRPSFISDPHAYPGWLNRTTPEERLALARMEGYKGPADPKELERWFLKTPVGNENFARKPTDVRPLEQERPFFFVFDALNKKIEPVHFDRLIWVRFPDSGAEFRVRPAKTPQQLTDLFASSEALLSRIIAKEAKVSVNEGRGILGAALRGLERVKEWLADGVLIPLGAPERTARTVASFAANSVFFYHVRGILGLVTGGLATGGMGLAGPAAAAAGGGGMYAIYRLALKGLTRELQRDAAFRRAFPYLVMAVKRLEAERLDQTNRAP